jgi:hemoglobin
MKLILMDRNYFQLIGEENLKKLVADFYNGIASDDILRRMYPTHLAPAEERLFWFLQQYLGGPATYNEKRGLPQLRKRHFPFPVDQAARDRWILLMERALNQNKMPDEAKLYLRGYFLETATFLINKG